MGVKLAGRGLSNDLEEGKVLRTYIEGRYENEETLGAQ